MSLEGTYGHPSMGVAVLMGYTTIEGPNQKIGVQGRWCIRTAVSDEGRWYEE